LPARFSLRIAPAKGRGEAFGARRLVAALGRRLVAVEGGKADDLEASRKSKPLRAAPRSLADKSAKRKSGDKSPHSKAQVARLPQFPY